MLYHMWVLIMAGEQFVEKQHIIGGIENLLGFRGFEIEKHGERLLLSSKIGLFRTLGR